MRIISIHAPREGGDDSTYRVGITRDYISIHAPREGGDLGGIYAAPGDIYFNPRPP